MAGIIGSQQIRQEIVINRMKIGMLLRSLRERNGKSQRDSALSMGYANATFVCNIEKRAAAIPIDKIYDFANEYGRAECNLLAGAIMSMVMPETWEACLTVFHGLFGKKVKIEEVKRNVGEWYDKKIDEFQIKF